jgi:hypothetical protein
MSTTRKKVRSSTPTATATNRAGNNAPAAPVTTASSHPARSALTGNALVHRLQQLADGVHKHAAEPGFPAFFAVNDAQAVHDRVALALVKHNAAKAVERAAVVNEMPTQKMLRALYEQAVLALEGYLGPANTALVEYGIKPRKGPASSRAKAVRTLRLNKRAKAKAAKAAVQSASSTSASTPSFGPGKVA